MHLAGAVGCKLSQKRKWEGAKSCNCIWYKASLTLQNYSEMEPAAPAYNAAVAKVRVHNPLAQAELPLAAALLLCSRGSCCICLLLQLLQLVPECRGVCIPA